MNDCHFCIDGNVMPGAVTVSRASQKRSAMIFVVKQVPADVCDTCGEWYITHETALQLDEMQTNAETAGIEVLVRKYLPAKVEVEVPSETKAAAAIEQLVAASG